MRPVGELLRVDAGGAGQAAIAAAVEVLGAGGIVAYPTETFYALGVSAFDERACRRVFELKGRPASKALPLIVSGWEQVVEVVEAPTELAARLAERFWPGPLTLVLKARPGVAAASERGTVAVRASGSSLARALATAAGPVTSTSANPSGAPEPVSAAVVLARLGNGVELILDGGETPGGPPSTIVDVSGSRPELVREGRIPFRDVMAAVS